MGVERDRLNGERPGVCAELLRVLARALVSRPDTVKVTQTRHQTQVVLLLEVAPEDVGRVIGRQGRIIKAIRKVVRTTCGPDGRGTVVEVASG